MLIINGTVHRMDGPVIENGFVAISGSKIAQVGPIENCPKNWTGDVFDAQGGHISSGFIDTHCHLGMFGDALGFESDDGNEETDPCTPHLRAIDAINPLDRCFSEAREAGVTTVLTGPGSANPISGEFAAIKTDGRWVDAMVVKAPISMKLALGENPKQVYHNRDETPVTRMAIAAIIRENLRKALEYGEKLDKADEDTDPPDYDAKLEALLPVVRGKLPVHIHAHRASDIVTGVRIAREFHLKCVIVHGTASHLIVDFLQEEGVPVITGPCLGDRSKPELTDMSLKTPSLLHKGGVPFAICTDHPEVPIQYLPLCAALAVKGGLDKETALSAITINAAKIAGLDEDLGSLTPGKEADIVVTDRHPLEVTGNVRAVFIGGRRI